MYQQDRKVAATCHQASARVDSLQFGNPRSKGFHDGAKTLLMESAATLEATALVEEKEDTEARRAGVKARAADEKLSESWENCYCNVYSHQLALRARDRKEGSALGEELDVTLEGQTPSSFKTLSVAAKAVTTRKLVTLAVGLLGDDEASVGQLRADLQLTQQAQEVYQRELGEKIDASSRLESARETARRSFQAARLVLEAALILEGRQEDVNQFIPAYYKINRPRRRTTGQTEGVEDEAEVDEFDDTEVTEPEPVA